MKRSIILLLSIWLLPVHSNCQGVFEFSNPGARTRIGSINGPIAGTNIWGQALVGLTPSSLSALGPALPHGASGFIGGELLTVPNAPPQTTVFVQLAAWDETLWGMSLVSVPANRIGYTDIAPVVVVFHIESPQSPQFMQPAVVPVPEPSVFAIAVLGGLGFLVARRLPHASTE